MFRKEDKYYYVEINNDYALLYICSTCLVERKTVGQNSGGGIKDTDLANEAEDFENYIKRGYRQKVMYQTQKEIQMELLKLIIKFQWNHKIQVK